jgi:uncharacterized protein with PQ loop repeat
VSLVLKHKKIKSKPKKANPINALIIPVAIIQPLMTIPQILVIFGNQSAKNVSILTWSAYNLASMVWLYYGFVHKEKAIIITQVLWIVVQTIIIAGILIYK